MNTAVQFEIDSHDVLTRVCGVNDENLKTVTQLLGAVVGTRGNQIIFTSENQNQRDRFFHIMERLQRMASDGRFPDPGMVIAIDNIFLHGGEDFNIEFGKDNFIQVLKREVHPRNGRQAEYIQAMKQHDIVFSLGPAGTGKTFLAIAQGLHEILEKKKRKIIMTRPVVEAGESLGFLPGDLADKLAPYLHPLYDAIEELIPIDVLDKLRDNNIIEVAPLAYMRGRTLKDCFIVLDEAQNTTVKQMKMFLTRIGHNSTAVITGDPSQIDLPKSQISGLKDSYNRLKGISGIYFSRFKGEDVVRHPLVQKIIEAYED